MSQRRSYTKSRSTEDRQAPVPLEPAFWNFLIDICSREGKQVIKLLADVDRMRGACDRASAVRVFILAYYRTQALQNPHGAGTRKSGVVHFPPILGDTGVQNHRLARAGFWWKDFLFERRYASLD